MSFQYRHCPFTPALFSHNRVVSVERRTIVPRVPREAPRNYNSQCLPQWNGIESEPQGQAGKLQLPACSGAGQPEAAGRIPEEVNSEVWVEKPRVGIRRHAASQGFDPGAKPGQHWRCPEHPVSAGPGPGWRALEWGSARLSEGGMQKDLRERRRRQSGQPPWRAPLEKGNRRAGCFGNVPEHTQPRRFLKAPVALPWNGKRRPFTPRPEHVAVPPRSPPGC